MRAPLLEAEGLGFRYDGPQVLHEAGLAVEPAEFVGVVGPNGSGKSTLLRLLAGLLKPRTGTVRLNGRLVAGLPRREIAREASFLPQGVNSPFPFTVQEIVAMGRMPHLGRFRPEGPEDRAAVRRAMELTAVAGMAQRPVTELSGGERQRVFLARALAQEAPLMLLDEPTASLDLLHAFQVLDLVRGHAARDGGAVAALHDLNLAARVCDRLVVLHAGRVAAAGPPREVLDGALLAAVFGVRARVTEEDGLLTVHVLEPA